MTYFNQFHKEASERKMQKSVFFVAVRREQGVCLPETGRRSNRVH